MPAIARSHAPPSPSTTTLVRFIAAVSTRLNAASNSACLPLKWWYSAPFVTRARFTVDSMLSTRLDRIVTTLTTVRHVPGTYRWYVDVVRSYQRYVNDRRYAPKG